MRNPTDYMRTALFVDFDNVFISLESEFHGDIADSFASHPADWLDWFRRGMHAGDSVERRIISRRCYINPSRFSKYRPYFTRAGFSVIDCPSLTSSGKNSADIQMVMDIMDLARHEVRYDEFIILSADADFTPVLLRLRMLDRQTAILANSLTAAAYKAACDLVVDMDLIVTDALGYAAASRDEPPGRVPQNEKEITEAIRKSIRRLVAQSAAPVPLAQAAHEIRKEFRLENDPGWLGYGSFKNLILACHDDTFVIDTRRPPGFIVDSERFASRDAAEVSISSRLIDRLRELTGLPVWRSELYRSAFVSLAQLKSDARSASLPELISRLATVPELREAQVRPEDIAFVVRALSDRGVWKVAGREPDSVRLAQEFRIWLIAQCERAQLNLSAEERQEVTEWLGVTSAQPAAKLTENRLASPKRGPRAPAES